MRTKKHQPRKINPDAKYNSVLVAKLVNRSMRSGKKTVAQKHVYQALESVADQTELKPAEILEKLISKVAPKKEVRSRRVRRPS